MRPRRLGARYLRAVSNEKVWHAEGTLTVLDDYSDVPCLPSLPLLLIITIVLRLHTSIMFHVGILSLAFSEEHGAHTSREVTVTLHLRR